MAALFDQAKLNADGSKRVELYEENILWIIDGEKRAEIKLASDETINLLAFLRQWSDRILSYQHEPPDLVVEMHNRIDDPTYNELGDDEPLAPTHYEDEGD